MTNLPSDFINRLTEYRTAVNRALSFAIRGANQHTPLLREAIEYATLNGGKRLRPLLVYTTAAIFSPYTTDLDRIAASVECIHSSSLIHDDLPAMDDDNLRRGKATCHIVFGEATAILAGDALLMLAFDLLSHTYPRISASQQIKMLHSLSTASGAPGMVGGQSLDLLAEGKQLSTEDIEQIHHLKTGALISASVRIGAIAGGCEEESILQSLQAFSQRIGLAFQLQDDVLDITSSTEQLGKLTKQDLKHEKATYAILYGVENTQKRIQTLMSDAFDSLKKIPRDTSLLKQLAEYSIGCSI